MESRLGENHLQSYLPQYPEYQFVFRISLMSIRELNADCGIYKSIFYFYNYLKDLKLFFYLIKFFK
jgi:hypothetical protein